MASTSSNIEVAIRKAFRRLEYNAGRFGGGLECSLVYIIYGWPDCVLLIVCVSANAWMLAFSVSKILLQLLSTFSSFSTLWKHALHTQSEGRSSVLLPTTLWKSLASTDSEVPRRRRLRESLTTLLQNGHFQTISIFHSATTAALITR